MKKIFSQFLYLYNYSRSYINNLFIDLENKVKIPQNDEIFFDIGMFENWNYSLKIKFKFNEKINHLALFFILKSYVLNSEYSPYALCTVFLKDGQMIVTQKESINWFKFIDYTTFLDWLRFRLQNDSKYDEEEEFYCIVILFSKTLIYFKDKKIYPQKTLQLLKPIYPWTDNFLEYFINSVEKIKLLEEKLKKYENK